jgi:hypothetical protein
VGGLVGENFEGTIQNATASGSVSGENNVGGLVGDNLQRSVFEEGEGDEIINEMINAGTIRDTFAVGTVSGSVNVGGLLGSNTASETDATGTVEQSYFDTTVSGTSQSESAGNATGLTTAEMQGQAARTNLSGFEFGVDWQTQTDPPDYPVLISLQQGTDTPTPQTVNVGGQDVPVEFTTENERGEPTVTSEDAVTAIRAFINDDPGVDSDTAVTVIRAFISV